MLITGIKSKPVYEPLRADVDGRYHVVLASGLGGDAALRVLRELRDAAAGRLQHSRMLIAQADNAARSLLQERCREIGVSECAAWDNDAALLTAFRHVLEDALMGTRLYVAGPEGFIGLAMRLALEFNLNRDEIRAEELGTTARRVRCVHCRSENEDVKHNIVCCRGCRRWLLVRDHYSRRLAAYMGVMVDAEAPGELPAIEVRYP